MIIIFLISKFVAKLLKKNIIIGFPIKKGLTLHKDILNKIDYEKN